jgi:hypothetical protein
VISRIWHGWTSISNANAYERLLREEVFMGIWRSLIPGFIDIQMLRRPHNSDVEFVTTMRLENREGIKSFAGEDYEACVVPPAARMLLSRVDERSQHYDIRIPKH